MLRSMLLVCLLPVAIYCDSLSDMFDNLFKKKEEKPAAPDLLWTYCDTHTQTSTTLKPINIQEISISPLPLVMPGKITVTLKVQVTKTIEDIDVALTLEKDMWLSHMKIPCVKGFGSCEHESLCNKLETFIADKSTASGDMALLLTTMELAGLDGHCPITKRNVTLINHELEMPEVPEVVAPLINGKYRMKIKMTEPKTDEELVCIDVKLGMKIKKKPCEGWRCFFSGR